MLSCNAKGYSNSNPARKFPKYKSLKQRMATDLLIPSTSGYEIGLGLGFMAQYFGAQAPVHEIAHKRHI
jgi:hypothetical protein